MAGKKQKNYMRSKGNWQDRKTSRSLDKLAEFEVFDSSILPKLKQMVLEDWPPEKIRKHFAPLMQVMMVKKGMQGNFQAIKDTLDRYEGTAVQRIQQKTVYAQMSKKELAALALQKLKDAKIIDVTGRVVKEIEDDEN